MAYTLPFLSADDLRRLPIDQRNQYLLWIASNGEGPQGDRSGHGYALINEANAGNWGELAYQLPIMQGEMQKFLGRAVEYADRVAGYKRIGQTNNAVKSWEGESRDLFNNVRRQFENLPAFLKTQAEPPPTFDETVNIALGVKTPQQSQQSVQPTQQTGKGSILQNGNLVLPNGQQISSQDPNYELYKNTYQWVETKKAEGKVINPDIEISPDMVQRFVQQASTELGPYYKQLFEQAQTDIKRGMQRIAEDTASHERDLGLQYGQALESSQESFARRGLEFSTDRERAEKSLAEGAQSALEKTQQEALRSAQDLGTRGERELGSSFFPTNLSQMRTDTQPIIGKPGQYGFSFGTGTRSLFDPQGGITGEQERRKLFEEQSRKKELENIERERRALIYR